MSPEAHCDARSRQTIDQQQFRDGAFALHRVMLTWRLALGQAVIMPRSRSALRQMRAHIGFGGCAASPDACDAKWHASTDDRHRFHPGQEHMNEKKPSGKEIRLTSLAACAG